MNRANLIEFFVVSLFAALISVFMWLLGSGWPTGYEFLLLMLVGGLLIENEEGDNDKT